MSPSLHPPTQYLHLITGDEGEFVAILLDMKDLGVVVDHAMFHFDNPSLTRRYLVSPTLFLKTGRPSLHLPSSNLLKNAINQI